DAVGRLANGGHHRQTRHSARLRDAQVRRRLRQGAAADGTQPGQGEDWNDGQDSLEGHKKLLDCVNRLAPRPLEPKTTPLDCTLRRSANWTRSAHVVAPTLAWPAPAGFPDPVQCSPSVAFG